MLILQNIMKKIGSKITTKKHADCHTVVISPTIEKWQLNSLLIWTLAWTACGIAFFYYMLTAGFDRAQFFVMVILVTIWLYFEIRIIRAFLWRKFGMEIIKIDQDAILIKDSIFQYGEAKRFELDELEEESVENIHINPKSYSKVMNDSFWVVGQGSVVLKYEDKEYFFGTQLENNDAEKLVKYIRSSIRKFKKEKELLVNTESDS